MNRLLIVATLLALGTGFAVACEPGAPPSASASPEAAPDPDGSRLLEILTVPGTDERAARLGTYLGARGPQDLQSVLEAYGRARYDAGPVAYLMLADWWAAFDPEAALVDTLHWPLHDRQLGVEAVVRAWARRDARAAATAVEDMQRPERRERALLGLVAGWQESGHEGLFTYIEKLPSGLMRQRALEVFMARKVTRDGVEATLRFAEAQPDDGERRFKLQVFRRVVTAVVAYDPERAARWAEKHADGPFGDGLLRRTGSAWAFRDGKAAFEWIVSVPRSEARDDALRETFRVWLNNERPQALAWMRAKGPSPGLGPAIPMVAVALTHEAPQEGLAWVDHVEDPDRREQTLVSLGGVWMRKDREAASAWLASAQLPEEVVKKIEEAGRGKPPRPRHRRRAAAGSAGEGAQAGEGAP